MKKRENKVKKYMLSLPSEILVVWETRSSERTYMKEMLISLVVAWDMVHVLIN